MIPMTYGMALYNVKCDGKMCVFCKVWSYEGFRAQWQDSNLRYEFPGGPQNHLSDKDKYDQYMVASQNKGKRMLSVLWKHTYKNLMKESSEEEAEERSFVKTAEAKLQEEIDKVASQVVERHITLSQVMKTKVVIE
ncbi:uncharacterized protein LAJ45_10122 [Morchella importuna]|uniref:uncharacterized protein n=1 Tax=Morchella importuna TaxID=1174673 RepID=UPI001E8CBAF5|nr:uncharacterized protein LAJ45_10122 [Morchella importuna]KAH8145799.1 hypothetical protein LAJ45_10122 [Morchella importuna]